MKVIMRVASSLIKSKNFIPRVLYDVLISLMMALTVGINSNIWLAIFVFAYGLYLGLSYTILAISLEEETRLVDIHKNLISSFINKTYGEVNLLRGVQNFIIERSGKITLEDSENLEKLVAGLIEDRFELISILKEGNESTTKGELK